MNAGRWAAAAILLAMLLIVGTFMWAVWRPPAPASSGADAAAGPPVAGEIRFGRPGGSWRLAARAVPAAGRAVAVTVSATDLQGKPLASRPTAVLRMLDMPMAPESVALVKDAAGSWRGSASLSMAGRWLLEVELNGERLNLVFEAGSR